MTADFIKDKLIELLQDKLIVTSTEDNVSCDLRSGGGGVKSPLYVSFKIELENYHPIYFETYNNEYYIKVIIDKYKYNNIDKWVAYKLGSQIHYKDEYIIIYKRIYDEENIFYELFYYILELNEALINSW